MKFMGRSGLRILIALVIVHAIMNGVGEAIYTATAQEGSSGLIADQWAKLKTATGAGWLPF